MNYIIWQLLYDNMIFELKFIEFFSVKSLIKFTIDKEFIINIKMNFKFLTKLLIYIIIIYIIKYLNIYYI